MFWPYLLLVVTLYFWISYVVLLFKWPRVRNQSISRHAAASKQAYYFFLPAQFLGGVTYLLFMIFYLIPVLHVPSLFVLVYTLALILYIIAMFLPDTQAGWKAKIHLHLANYFAVGLGLSSAILFFSSTTHGISKIVAGGAAFYQASAAMVIMSKHGHPEKLEQYLLIQSVYIAATQILLLTLAFTS